MVKVHGYLLADPSPVVVRGRAQVRYGLERLGGEGTITGRRRGLGSRVRAQTTVPVCGDRNGV